MTTGKALEGTPHAGNLYTRFDEGEIASAATPRRGSLLYKRLIAAIAGTLAACALPAAGYEYIISGDPIAASTNHACIAPLAPQSFVTGGYDEATTRVLALRSDEYHAFMLIIR